LSKSRDIDITHTSLIDEVVSILTTYTDIPVQLLRPIGYIIIAELFAEQAVMENAPRRNFRPNVMFQVNATSGMARKGTQEEFIRDVLIEVHKSLNRDRVKPPKAKKEESEGGFEWVSDPESEEGEDPRDVECERVWMKHKLESGTEEGIADRIVSGMDTMNGGWRSFLLLGGEYGPWLLKAADPTGPWAGGLSLINKMYYGEGYDSSLSTRGPKATSRFIPVGVFANGMLYAQKLTNWLKPWHITVGFMRRLIVVSVEAKDLDPDRIVSPLADRTIYRRKVIPDLIEKLVDLKKKHPGKISIVFHPDVAHDLAVMDENGRRRGIEEAKSGASGELMATYHSTDWEKRAKLASLEALADPRAYLTGPGGSRVVMVTPEHHEKARAPLESWQPSVDKIVRTLDPEMEGMTPQERERKLQQDIILIWLETPKTVSDTRAKHRWKNYDSVMASLAERGLLHIEELPTEGGYLKAHFVLGPAKAK
jgi:hypothetical protein